MTEFLIHKFAGEEDLPDDPHYRGKIGKLSGIAGIICNGLLCVMKIIAGSVSGSISITADAMNNLSDATSSVVTLLGFRLAEIPADKRHPFGHARFEYISGVTIAVMILIIGVRLLETSVVKIIHPSSIEFSFAAAAVLVLSILVKLWLSVFNMKLSHRIGSDAIMATALDSRNDIFSTGAVLIAALVEVTASVRIDGYVGAAVAVFIIVSGAKMGIQTISPLIGEASNPEICDHIIETVSACPKVLGYHDLMVHDYGPGKRFATIHVEMDCKEDPLESHELIDELERKCRDEFNVDLVIHYDPVIVGDSVIDYNREKVEKLLKEVDERLTMHDFRMVQGNGRVHLIFDVVMPYDMQERTEEIRQYIESNMTYYERKRYYATINYDVGVYY